MGEESIDYRPLIQNALLGVVRVVMERAAAEGLPGDHHFYITFASGHPGVSIPEPIRSQHPEEMTVVLQNQFWDLEVDSASFSVTLRFGGEPARLTVPFEALRAFVDPVAELGLKFGEPEATGEEPDRQEPDAAADGESDDRGTVLPFPRPPG